MSFECQHPFAIYLAGAEAPLWRKVLTEEHASHVCVNFLNLLPRLPKTKPYLLADRFPDDMEILVDSGGYGAEKKGINPDTHVRLYTEWVDLNRDRISLVTEFDPAGAELDWIERWREEFWDDFPKEKFVPIWHPEHGIEELEHLCRTYKRVGLTKPDPGAAEAKMRSLAVTAGTQFHGVAITGPDDLRRLPLATASSTSWISPTRYGDTQVWAGGRFHWYPAKSKTQSRKRHRPDIERAGFNPDLYETGDRHTVARYTVWAWQQYEQSLSEKRARRGSLTLLQPEVADTTEVVGTSPDRNEEGGAVDTSAPQTRTTELVRREEKRVFPGIVQTFEKTVNPQEGEPDRIQVTSLAESGLRHCDSCLVPSTQVLSNRLIWGNIGDVQVGDVLTGFDEHPWGRTHRSYREAKVEEVRWSRRQTWRIITDHGEVVTTREHPWLIYPTSIPKSARGWQRADALAPGMLLRGMEVLRSAPGGDRYKGGYIAGLTEGDGTFRYNPQLPRSAQPQPYWRVAMADKEALERLVDYLAPILARVQPFNPGRHREGGLVKPALIPQPMFKVESRAVSMLEHVLRLITWSNTTNSRQFAAGYLAGIFDSDGSYDGSSLRIYANNRMELEHCQRLGRLIGLDFYREEFSSNVLGCGSLRLRGGNEAVRRFFMICRPAVTRKMDKWWGREMTLDPWKIEAVEPGPWKSVVDIQTSTSTFFAAGLATHNCYLSSRCPAFKPGAECAFKMPIQIHTKEQLLASLRSLLEMQMARVAFARAGEEADGGIINQDVSAEVERYFKMVEKMKEIQSDSSFLRIEAKGPQGQGILSELLAGTFGRQQGAALGAQARALNDIDPVRAERLVQDVLDVEPVEDD